MNREDKPTCPSCLGKEARAEWARQVKELEATGHLSKKLRAILASYCQAWELFSKACKTIASEGEVVPGSRNNQVMNPWVRIMEAAAARMARLAERFGFSPAGEAKVKPKKLESGPKLFSRQRA